MAAFSTATATACVLDKHVASALMARRRAALAGSYSVTEVRKLQGTYFSLHHWMFSLMCLNRGNAPEFSPSNQQIMTPSVLG